MVTSLAFWSLIFVATFVAAGTGLALRLVAGWSLSAVSLGLVSVVAILVAGFITYRSQARTDEIAKQRRHHQYVVDLNRSRHPLESVADRLSYESSSSESHSIEDHPSPEIVLPEEIETNLQALEQRPVIERGERSVYFAYLQEIHTATEADFVAQPGKGIGRMRPPLWFSPVQPEPESIPLLASIPDYDPDHPSPVDTISQSSELLGLDDYRARLSLHQSGLQQFLDPAWIGHVGDRHQVAGFVSHGFYQKDWPARMAHENAPWHISRLELVSLLKHETPRVYVLESLPRMDQLAEVETRPLDSFETEALSLLSTDEDLITDESTRHIKMLGSIRAGASCLECHSVQRGELLGAFSYELRQHAMP